MANNATNNTLGEVQLAGDLGGNNNALAPELPATGVTAGQYNPANITVNSKGLITAISNTTPADVTGLIPKASTSVAGLIKVGDGLLITGPVASAATCIFDYGAAIVGTDSTGLNNDSCTTYNVTITVDGGSPQLISVPGDQAQDFDGLMSYINGNLTGAALSIVGGDLELLSGSVGQTSTLVVSTPSVFECITGYVSTTCVQGDDPCELYVPCATTGQRGIVQIGSGIDVDANGVISVDLGTLPIATNTAPVGGVIVPVSGNLVVDGSGNVSVPIASSSTLGVITVTNGDGLTLDGSGNLTFDDSAINLPIATTSTLGTVIVPNNGDGLDVDGSGNLTFDDSGITIPTATDTILGGVIVPNNGDGLDVDGSGNLTFDDSGITIPIASTTTLGQVKVPTSGNLDVDGSGNISVPLATTSTVGVVEVGSGLAIDGAGLLSFDESTLNVATTSSLGVVQVGTNIDVSAGVISVAVANGTSLGLVKQGSTGSITINASGEVDADLSQIVQIDKTNTFTKAQIITPVVANISGAASANLLDSNNFEFTLTGNVTSFDAQNQESGGIYNFIFIQDATGSRTLAFDTEFKFAGGTAPVASTGANAIDMMRCVSDGTSLFCEYFNDFS